MELLKDLMNLIDISLDEADDAMIDRLEWIIESVTDRLKIRLGGIEVPQELSYIIVEVSAVRFNRAGSEGFSHHEVEGETSTIMRNDFEPYEPEIKAWLDLRNQQMGGKVRFL